MRCWIIKCQVNASGASPPFQETNGPIPLSSTAYMVRSTTVRPGLPEASHLSRIRLLFRVARTARKRGVGFVLRAQREPLQPLEVLGVELAWVSWGSSSYSAIPACDSPASVPCIHVSSTTLNSKLLNLVGNWSPGKGLDKAELMSALGVGTDKCNQSSAVITKTGILSNKGDACSIKLDLSDE